MEFFIEKNEIANILMELKGSNEITERCPTDDDDLGGLVGSMNDLSLELTKNEENKSSCVKSNETSIETNIIKTQCTLFSNIIVLAQMLHGKTIELSIKIIQIIILICFAIFNYSIKLADLIDRVTIVKLPFVSIGRLLVYGYWYSLIYVIIRQHPWLGQLLHAIFENIIRIINTANTVNIPVTPAYIINELANDEAFNGIISAVKTTASDAATELGDIVYDYMFNLASKIPILLAIHQLLQIQNTQVDVINDHLHEITYGQQQIIDGQQQIIDGQNQENAELIIQQFDELTKRITGLDKIYTDTNLYLQGIDATIQGTSERLGLQIHDVNTAQKNIIQRLNMQDTQATTKLITDLFFAGAPQLMGLAEAIGVPLPRGLLGNGDTAFGGKKRSTRRKCKRSKVYKRGSSRKRGICKNTKKRVKSKKSKKSKKPSKRRMKNTKRK